MPIDIEEVTAFLATDEGKALVESHEVTEGLRNKRDSLLHEKDTWRKKNEAYEKLGDIDTLTAALADLNKKKTEGKDVDEDLLETLRTQITEKDAKLNATQQRFLSTLVDGSIESAIANAKGNSKLLKHLVQGRLKTTFDDDGNVVIEAYSKDGKKIYKRDETPGTIEDIVEELRNDPDYGAAFAGSGANGSGTRTTTSTTKGGVIMDRNDPNFDYSKYMEWAAKNSK